MRTPIMLLLCFAFIFSFPARAQTFECDGSFIISLHDGSPPANAYQINYDGVNVDFQPLVNFNYPVNSLGFNRLDNYLYGIYIGSNEIIRLKSDGTVEVVGSEPDISEWSSGAGDCNLQGEYVVHDRITEKLFFYNVTNGFSKTNEVVLEWHPSSGNTGIFNADIDDIVFDPYDPGSIYTYQRNHDGPNNGPAATKGFLLRIEGDPDSPDFGKVFSVGKVPESVTDHVGAAFFSVEGVLFGYGAEVLDPGNFDQDRFFRIDKNTADAELIGTGPFASYNDGCSCPYTLDLFKELLTTDLNCFTESIAFEFRLVNNAQTLLEGLIFEDEFPAGFLIESMEGVEMLGGTIQPGTGIGTPSLEIENISLEAETEWTFTVTVSSPAIPGTYENQATLSGLPNSLAAVILSDDPNTEALNDPTAFEIEDLNLSNINVFAKDPANCITQDDGVIQINAQGLFPLTTYEFTYTFEGVPQGPFVVETDASGTFMLENLEAGLYEDFMLSNFQGTCSADLTGSWELMPPEGLPELMPVGPDTLCAGDALLISATEVEGGVYSWMGPEGFTADASTISIPESAVSNSGYYYLEVEANDCYRQDSIFITVVPSPEINLAPAMSLEQCERKPLPLSTGPGAYTFQWTPDAGLDCADCPNPIAAPLTSVSYSVLVLTDLGCDATASIYVEVANKEAVYFPNAFSPNGDGQNDEFIMYTDCGVEEVVEFIVFDRWGNLVHEAYNFAPDDLENGWDGYVDGKLKNPDVFVWIATIRFADGSQTFFKGDVHLIR